MRPSYSPKSTMISKLCLLTSVAPGKKGLRAVYTEQVDTKFKKETFLFDARSSTSQSDSQPASRHGGVNGRKTKRKGAAAAAFP